MIEGAAIGESMGDESLERFRRVLRSHGYEVTSSEFRSRPVVVGRSSQFRWKWMASRLHTFVIVADFSEQSLDRSEYDRFLSVACGYAVANPVAANLDSGVLTYPRRMIVGRIFYSHLKDVCDHVVAQAVTTT